MDLRLITEVSAAGLIDSTPYHPPAKVIALAFPVSLTTIPFPVIVAYSGLISLPEQPKRKASSLICQPMVSHSPVCKLHTQRINSLKSSIICTAPNQLFSLIVSRHTHLTIWCRRGFWNAFLSTVTKAETKTKCWMQNESPRCTILCGAFFLILSWDLFVPVHLMLLVLS